LSTNNSLDEQLQYRNDPRYKLMHSSYPNAMNGSLPSLNIVRQINPQNNASAALNPQQQQQADMLAAVYHNYRRRSSGFSS
ncbi:unnamed protein product, partial [Rotaria magnacalcarata]